MNAKETYEMTRRFGALDQYHIAKSNIQQAKDCGQSSCIAADVPLFFEVALKLVGEGFKVRTKIRKDMIASHTKVSWTNEKNTIGILQVVNDAKYAYEKMANALGYGILVPGVIYVINSEEKLVAKDCNMEPQNPFENTQKIEVLKQYYIAKKHIYKEANYWGGLKYYTHAKETLFFEVALQLAKEGFDIITVLRDDNTYTAVSWMKGWKEDNLGTLKVINEAKYNYEEIANKLGYEILVPGIIYVINSKGEPVPEILYYSTKPNE